MSASDVVPDSSYDERPPSESFAVDPFAADGWDETLAQFARATGLAVTLFDAAGELRAGPFAPTPLARRLEALGAWDSESGGACYVRDKAAAARAIETEKIAFNMGVESLALFAVPARFADRTVGAVVAGWALDRLPAPMAADRVAKVFGTDFPDFWHVARLQVPLSGEKLTTYAWLLETLVDAFMRERANTLREQETARVLLVLNRSAQRLTGATRTDEVGSAAAEAARLLVRAELARLLVPEGDDWRVAASSSAESAAGEDSGEDENKEGRAAAGVGEGALRVPVKLADGTLVGLIETSRPERVPTIGFETQMSALAAQVAVALQKSRLIEDLRAGRATLERMDRVKDEFLATVSHELRTPLNAMLGWAQLLRAGSLDEKVHAHAIETIERNALAQAHLIEDLLDVSRIITGKLRLRSEPIDLGHVVGEAIEAVRPAADARSIRVAAAIPAASAPLTGDAGRLQQVFWNLLSNAVKFTPRGGTVWVEVAPGEEGQVEVSVRDSGRGIAPEFLPHVFERFTQADGSTTRTHGGLGLGLGIVRHLVELHGGQVRAESPGPGAGAAFTVSLPLLASAGADDGAGPSAADRARRDLARMPSLEGWRVVAVDDEPDSLDVLVLALERAGASVRSFMSAASAFDEVRRWRPDLLVADIGMPEEDGYSLARRVRELAPDEGGRTPAIALTAYARREDSDAARDAGFDAHVAKPVEPFDLVSLVARLLGGARDEEAASAASAAGDEAAGERAAE